MTTVINKGLTHIWDEHTQFYDNKYIWFRLFKIKAVTLRKHYINVTVLHEDNYQCRLNTVRSVYMKVWKSKGKGSYLIMVNTITTV